MADTSTHALTPLREFAKDRDKEYGCWRLSTQDVDYLDGSEDRLLEIVQGATDLSSLSDELQRAGTNWPEKYSLFKGRANVLRPLALGQQHTVLEVGAGCGAITRYLGETCGAVDALEPVAARARVARERTRDLPNVEVFIGGISDIPPVPAYDVVVVVGVLEYAGDGGGPEPHIEFLTRLASLLRPGGQMVCAIENRLGVKYLVGAPEDHSGRVFDGIEDYPQSGHARTFSRSELMSLFEAAGLHPRFFHAFPDYKLARSVFSDDLLSSPEARRLAWQTPWFPSPDWTELRPRLADERRLWRSLVEDGVAEHFGNSFLVLASTGAAGDLWDSMQLGRYFNTQRQAPFATETSIIQTDLNITMRRRRLVGADEPAVRGNVLLKVASHESYSAGENLLELLAACDDGQIEHWLGEWLNLLRSDTERPRSADLVPHNLIVEGGRLLAIDQEWRVLGYAESDVIQRGLLWLASHLADLTPPDRWHASTVAELAEHFREVIGVTFPSDWIFATLRREATLQALVTDTRANWQEWRRFVDETYGLLRNIVNRRLSDGPLGTREHELRRSAEWRLAELQGVNADLNNQLQERNTELEARNTELHEAREALAQRQAHLEAARQELAAMRGSLGWRILEAYRRPVRWLFPRGSRRAAPYRLAVKAVDWFVSGAAKLLALARRSRILAARSRQIIRSEGWRVFVRRARRKAISTLRRRPMPTAPLPITYEEWINATEPGADELGIQRRTSSLLPYRPLISIITPVWNPAPVLLRKTIESVCAQTYDNWELCLADGGSTSPEVRGTLEEFAVRDARIKVQFLDENRGISRNSNAALEVAAGEYVAFLDHTDVLAPNALWELCALLNRDPGADCVYSDHDLISEDDVRHQPLFKPEFSPEMLFSANYLAHFCAFRRDLVERLGGLRPETDGAQDWDLTLRALAAGAHFARVPRVLYHWRTDSGSAVTSPEAKPYALRAQERAIQDYLDSCGMPGHVVRDEYGGPAVKWSLSGRTRVSIIIPTKHNRKLLEPCLRSIGRSQYSNWEIIVIDSAGRTGDREQWYERMQRTVPFKVLWWEHPFNFSAVNNFAAAQADGDALLFLNDDTEARSPGWLNEMVGWLEREGIGAVGAQLTFSDGTIQHGGDTLGLQGFADHLFTGSGPNDWTLFGSTHWYRNLTASTAACLLVDAALFRRIGGFNERFHLCGSDVELCIRVRRAGYRIICTPFAGVIHHERSTRGTWDVKEDAFTSFWYYQPFINGGDPYYSPNLSIFSSIPQLRHPQEPTPAQVISPVIGRELTATRQGSADIEKEAETLVEWCQIRTGEIEATRELHEANSEPFDIRSINWFIPDMVSPFYGGIHTILRFAAHFKNRYGVENRFIVMGSGPEPFVRSGITAAFPELAQSDIRICSLAEDDIRSQPYADASIASLWVTAFAVSKFANTRRKFYMVQDYEPVFYPAGTLYALSEATYRLGLYGLCNTLTLRDIYQNEYGGKGFGFIPAVDTALFHPPEGPRHDGDTMMLFLYGRPGHWRNCYELAISTLRRLKQRLKRKVRVVTAGSWVASGNSESAYLVDNLGLLDYKDTADLYRKCDAGLTLSVSKHPSYLPLELMASGSLVVSNYNPSGFWLLRNEENCLLAEPTAESLCAALERALTDDSLRDRLSKQAVDDIQANHADWPSQMDAVYRYICNPEGK